MKNRLRFDLVPFLSYKAALKYLFGYTSSLDLRFLLKTALEMRVILQNSWRKGEIEMEKSSAFTWAAKRYKVLRLKHYYFTKWLATETENNNSLLLASVKTLIIQHIKAAFWPYWRLIGGETEAQQSFCNQHPGQEGNNPFPCCWPDSFQHNTEYFHPSCRFLPPQGWKLFQLVPSISPANWNWVPKVQWQKSMTVIRKPFPSY